MQQMTLDDLFQILVRCAGESDELDPSTDQTDIAFDDLGYDSLALIEATTVIEQRYGVTIADERIPELRTPRHVLELVNGALTGSA